MNSTNAALIQGAVQEVIFGNSVNFAMLTVLVYDIGVSPQLCYISFDQYNNSHFFG